MEVRDVEVSARGYPGGEENPPETFILKGEDTSAENRYQRIDVQYKKNDTGGTKTTARESLKVIIEVQSDFQ